MNDRPPKYESDLLFTYLQINLGLNNASGATICLQTTASCDTPAKLCASGDDTCEYSIIKSGKCTCCPVGPPVSPPPMVPGDLYPPPQPPHGPSPVPFCKCNKTAGVTPFSLAPATVTSKGTLGSIYTWTVLSSTPIDPKSPCANTLLYKAEIWSNPNCVRAVRRAYINGQAVSPSWDPVNAVWKVTNIKMSALKNPGPVGTIGFELDANGPCPTLNSLCHNVNGICEYALFDASKTCCPEGSILA